VFGDPDAIIRRGKEITELGEQMESASLTLFAVANSTLADGQQEGKAVEKLQETVGETWKVLGEAARLYKPVGPVLVRYGNALESYKRQIDHNADQCCEKWPIYLSLPGDKDGSLTPEADGGFRGRGGHDADSPEAEQEAADNQAKKAAYEAWEASAESFDSWYDSWEDAFESAASEIGDEMAGEIKDGRWEYLDNLVDVLGWVGLALGIAALVIGGPIIAALAAAVAVIVLVSTIALAVEGRKSWSDVGWALVDIVPFGKAGRLAKYGSKVDEFADGHMLNPQTYKKVFTETDKIWLHSKQDVGLKALTGKTGDQWKKVWSGEGSYFDMAAFRARTSYWNNDRHFADGLVEYPIRLAGATLESAAAPAENFLKLEGYYSTVTGDESLKKQYPILNVF
jgi:hypothetical protein